MSGRRLNLTKRIPIHFRRRSDINPYIYIAQATEQGESLLSLCCGIGLELGTVGTTDITAVDIAEPYIEQLVHSYPFVKAVCSDALTFLKMTEAKSYDVISIIDGIEHMEKQAGLQLIKQMKRVVRKQILLFTPQGPREGGYLKNEPHNAWGVEGVDEHQTHKSGWTLWELEKLGFTLIKAAHDISQHGEPYTALMMKYDQPEDSAWMHI